MVRAVGLGEVMQTPGNFIDMNIVIDNKKHPAIPLNNLLDPALHPALSYHLHPNLAIIILYLIHQHHPILHSDNHQTLFLIK